MNQKKSKKLRKQVYGNITSAASHTKHSTLKSTSKVRMMVDKIERVFNVSGTVIATGKRKQYQSLKKKISAISQTPIKQLVQMSKLKLKRTQKEKNRDKNARQHLKVLVR